MMFNSITKKFKSDQPPPDNQRRNNEEMEGFICPVCMASFNTPDLVQKHFDTSHNDLDNKKSNVLSPSVERKESIKNIQENLNDLKQSLDEEVWFNKELQKEIGRLQNLLKEKDDDINKKNEQIETHSKSLAEMENNFVILTEEMKKVRVSSDALLRENEKIKSDHLESEGKMHNMLKAEEELRRFIDKQRLECESVSQELSAIKLSAESTNCQSPEMNDIIERFDASEKHVRQLQMEIDELNTNRDKSLKELNSQCFDWKEKVTNYEREKSELLSNHQKLISDLHNQMDSIKMNNSQLLASVESIRKALAEKEDKIVQITRNWETDQSTLENTLTKLNEVDSERQKLKAQNQELAHKMKNLESDMMQQSSLLDQKEEEIKNARKANANLTDELNETRKLLETEKTEKCNLQSQVEMSDAANLVMEQLQSEKKILQESLVNSKKQMEKEVERCDSELSILRTKMQSEKEEIFNLNSILVEKDEQIKEAAITNSEHLHSIEKCEKKIELEASNRSKLEDEIVVLKRDLAARNESINTFHINYNGIKDDLEKSTKKFEKAGEDHKNQLMDLNNQLEMAKSQAAAAKLLENEIASKDSNIKSLENELKIKILQLQDLSTNSIDLQNQIADIQKILHSSKESISSLQKSVEDRDSEIRKQNDEIMENKSKIDKLTQQIENDTQLLMDHEEQISISNNKIVELHEEIKQRDENSQNLKEEIKNQEIKQKILNDDNLSLKSEIDIIKRDLLEKEDVVASLSKNQQSLENSLAQSNQDLKDCQQNCNNMKNEKFDLSNELNLCKIQVDNLQELYSDSMKQQNEYKNKFDVASVDLINTKKFLKNLEEQQKVSHLEYSKELDHLRKEETQLSNHVKALTKTLNESSENYKQERLEAADKEFTLKSQNESLQTNLDNLTKSLQRTDEDLETEKNLRESERNNMMGKISQLSEQIVSLEALKSDNEQKLELLETDNIENKLRLELVNEEKDKLLEKIIQLENNTKKQSDLYSKKCRELDQLQSAILDLGRENQSLQISKEKLTNRHWIGDVEAIDCYTCRKSFSLTLRKHHCRSCGQVYCQDCSSKSASLAVSRNPVRVCDGCYVEIQSHRKNSNVSSTSIGLQM